MSSNYPAALDVFTNPNPNDHLDSPNVPHSQQHSNANDAIEAIQSVLGISPSGAHLTVKDRIEYIENSLGTISNQDYDNVSITGGSIVNLSVFDGNIIDGGTF